MEIFDLDKLEKYSKIAISEDEKEKFIKDFYSFLEIIKLLDRLDI